MSCFQKQFTLIPFHCVRGDSYASCAALTNRKSAWLGSAICSANGSGPACDSGRSLSGGLRSPPCSEGLALTWVVMMDPQSAVDRYSIPYCAGCRRFRVGQRRFRRKTIMSVRNRPRFPGMNGQMGSDTHGTRLSPHVSAVGWVERSDTHPTTRFPGRLGLNRVP